ncbi:MAG: phosphoribosylaminoimidazole-succinocarboxamide synthase [Mycobacteriales bacterium]
MYAVDGEHLLIVATDRLSAYDVVLPTPIPDKGRVLTALSVWWFEQLGGSVPHHFVSVDDPRIPAAWRGRAMLCRRLSMLPVECVARGYLAGSGVTDYQRTGAVCGVPLPPGLTDGDRLPEPIFTPATKATVGAHDENVSFDAVARLVGAEVAGHLRELTLAIYRRGAELARRRGLLLADTKLEFGTDPAGVLTVGDEVLTPDSSRFWPADGWQPGRPQPSFDKQYIRDWVSSPAAGWDRSAGAPPPELPPDVVDGTRARYVDAYQRITGLSFSDWLGAGAAEWGSAEPGSAEPVQGG